MPTPSIPLHVGGGEQKHAPLSLKRLDPGSGRNFPAIWHGAGAYHGACIPETKYSKLDTSAYNLIITRLRRAEEGGGTRTRRACAGRRGARGRPWPARARPTDKHAHNTCTQYIHIHIHTAHTKKLMMIMREPYGGEQAL